MTKIMLVEDDNNLREIYEARLAAEGYEIVSAQDGEAALALAGKERPDLIITDVMMPKISGFEMLDILRNTPALREVKVIMLTALGQAEDNARAGSLGADRYLVKSQVTLEDIVKATHDVLEGFTETPQATAEATATAAPIAVVDTPAVVTPSDPAAAPADDTVATPPVEDTAPSDDDAQTPASDPVATSATPTEDEAAAPVAASPSDDTTTDEALPAADVAPLELPTVPDKPAEAETEAETPTAEPELAIEPAPEVAEAPSAAQEESDMKAQIDQFLQSAPAEPPAAVEPQPAEEPAAAEPVAAEPSEEPAPETNVDPAPESEPAPESSPETEHSDTAPEESLPEDTSSSDGEPPAPFMEGASLTPTPTAPPDEPESEYTKDDQTPDMGELAVHLDEAATTPVETAAPQPPAPEEVIPAPPQPVVPPPTPQSPGDQIVSDAIDSMSANSDGNQPPQIIPAGGPSLPLPDAEPVTEAAETPAGAVPPSIEPPSPSGAEPEEDVVAVPEMHTGGGSFRSRVITPPSHTGKRDINQLLSLEEAKNGASQAGAQPIDPGSISL